MKQRWAVLIDLDQTLIETSELTGLRQQKQWDQVYQSFHLTTLYPGTHQFLQEIQKIPLSLGVVTTSPRSYAERLIAYHSCQIPVVVAYHDTKRHKPDPDPILQAAAQLRIPAANCFHIGDAPNDIIAAVRASAIPIGLSWNNSLTSQRLSLPPFHLCSNWSEVVKLIKATFEAKEI